MLWCFIGRAVLAHGVASEKNHPLKASLIPVSSVCVVGDALKNTSFLATGPRLTALAAAALLLVHSGAFALSLGRLTVQSSLGEALRAEIDVTNITAEEAGTLRAAVASPEAFKAAGVDFNAALSGAQAQLVKRPDGRSVIRVTGDRTVTEPFVDVLLDLGWNGGRLQRAYTLLIDPPTRAAAPSPAPAVTASPVISPAPVQAAPVPPTPAAQPAPVAVSPVAQTPSAQPSRPAPLPKAAPAPKPLPEPKVKPEAPAKAPATQSADVYRVRSGDTLSKIAANNLRPGVSLDQMLVAMYRNNPQAFIGDNMNRLKAGVVMNVADAQAKAADLPAGEARQIIQAQSADFAAFRQHLAGAAPVVKTVESARTTKGKVEAAVEDRKAGPAAAPDKLTLSKGGLKAGAAEAKVSKETERKAADARVAELSRNVEELKKLTAVAATASSGTAAKTPAVAPSIPVPKPVPMPPPPVVVAASAAPATAPAASKTVPSEPVPSTAVAKAPDAPASLPAAPASVASDASAPASAPKMLPATADAAAEPSFFDSLADNPLVLPGAAALVAALAGLGLMRLRRRNQEGSGETSFIESKLQPDSFFGVSGGQRVDTRDGPASASSSSLSYSLSQLDAIGDVDPVAEADVYLAYGRDLQAEEILKEALRADGSRVAIRAKLLEVYAKRADAKGFEAQARQLQQQTGGEGEEWAKAAELGRTIDPTNSLYAGAGVVAEPLIETPSHVESSFPDDVLDDDATVVRNPEPAHDQTLPLGAAVAGMHTDEGPASTFDVDIDLDSPSQLVGLEATRPMLSEGGDTTPGALHEFAENTVRGALDGHKSEVSDQREAQNSGLGELPPLSLDDLPPHKEAQVSGPVDFDFGDLSLDLDKPADVAEPAPAAAMVDDLDLGGADPLVRKIELADEFRRIGDIEGARDLLEEVVGKAEGALQSRAQTLLDELK